MQGTSQQVQMVLRPATEADALLLLEWQQHPDTRRHARNPAVPIESYQTLALVRTHLSPTPVARFKEDRERLSSADRAGTLLRAHELLQQSPYATQKTITARTGLSHPTANRSLGHLQALGIVNEIAGRKRERVYAYRRYLDILREGAEPLKQP